MEILHGFPPVSRADARCLVLGSMPSRKSLADTRYYAHPRNAFWRITGQLFGFDAQAPYQQRLEALMDARVALWDVIASCSRTSSLDSDIMESSIMVNDFEAFFAGHPQVAKVYFNGAKAEQSFRKYVVPTLTTMPAVPGARLPSTSPANAGMTFEKKLEAWREVAITAGS